MKKAVKVVLVGIVIILSLYWYSQQSSQTEKPNFDMNGTIENITIPCPFNVQCNPQYWLAGEDGNTYHLLISSGTRLPNGGQQICEGLLALQEPCLTRLPNGGQQICEGLLALQEPCLTRLPTRGQHIEVIGIVTYDTISKCELNGQAGPCQPIGRVMVSSWQPR